VAWARFHGNNAYRLEFECRNSDGISNNIVPQNLGNSDDSSTKITPGNADSRQSGRLHFILFAFEQAMVKFNLYDYTIKENTTRWKSTEIYHYSKGNWKITLSQWP
jgi:hypothetical protein